MIITCGDVDDVALFQRHLARVTVAAPEKAPLAFEDKERLGRVVIVQGVAANSATDDGKVFFLIRPRCVGVDESGLARL